MQVIVLSLDQFNLYANDVNEYDFQLSYWYTNYLSDNNYSFESVFKDKKDNALSRLVTASLSVFCDEIIKRPIIPFIEPDAEFMVKKHFAKIKI
jgi:hypothetical protein